MATTWVSRIDFDDHWPSPVREATADGLDWAELFSRYHLNVRAFVRSRVPAAWVDDTVQDTFVRAYRSRHRLDPTRPVWPWLVTIAKRACIETCRNQRGEVAFDGGLHAVASPDDPHVEFERGQRAAAIATVLESLPPRHRRLLVRYEVEGQSYEVLAGEEEISGQALKSVLCRARESFRTRYTALAEANGLAALPVLGPLLVRWRSRWNRGHDAVARMSPEMAGALMVGLTATVWLVGVPAAQKASSAPAMTSAAMVGAALGAAVPDVAVTPTAVEGNGAVGHGSPVPAGVHLDALQSGPGGGTTGVVPRLASSANLVTGPEGSTATMTIEIRVDTLGARHGHKATMECGDGVSTLACRVVRATPVGH